MLDLAPNCYGFWKMNENAANTDVEDFSSQGNEGTFTDATGNPYTNQHDATGKINGALLFDGVDDYINIGTMGDFGSNMNNVTIAVWVKTTVATKSSLYGIFNDGYNTALNFNVSANSNGYDAYGRLQIYMRDENNSRISGAVDYDTGIADGNWHFLVATVQKSLGQINFFVDNSHQTTTYGGSVGTGTDFANFQYDVFLGACSKPDGASKFFAGSLDNFMIFDKALSSDERSFLWNEGNGRESLSELHRRLVGGSLAANKRGLVCI